MARVLEARGATTRGRGGAGLFCYPERHGRGLDLRGLPLVAFDVETTGLDPATGRIVEIALVRTRPDGTVLDEWCTLLDPGCDTGAVWIHGITDSMVRGVAPTFGDIAGEILSRIEGALVVAHNASFDESFLAAELARIGLQVPTVPAACTLTLARSILNTPNYKLATCCEAVGVTNPAAHAALGDARVTAQLARWLLARPGAPLAWRVGPSPLPVHPGRARPRPRPAGLRKGSDGWMANLVAGLPASTGVEPSPAEVAAYFDALDEALADGKVIGTEAKTLARLAANIGLGGAEARALHRRYLDGLVAGAGSAHLSAPQANRLAKVAAQLGESDYVAELGVRPMRTVTPAEADALTAEAQRRTADLLEQYAAVDGMLAAALARTPGDLASLRRTPVYPPFPRPDLLRPLPEPPALAEPTEPVRPEPAPPRGLRAVFGRRRAVEAARRAADERHEQALAAWREACAAVAAQRRRYDAAYRAACQRRATELAAVRAAHEEACLRADAEAAEHNRRIDALVAGLSAGTPDAVEWHARTALTGEAWPEVFPVGCDLSYSPVPGELRVDAVVPPPEAVPSVKEFRFVRTRGEVAASSLPARARRDRYASALTQVALRAAHQVLRDPHLGVVGSVDVVVWTDGRKASGPDTEQPLRSCGTRVTGRSGAAGAATLVPLASLRVTRSALAGVDLRVLAPHDAFVVLGGRLSSDPLGLTPVAPGVREPIHAEPGQAIPQAAVRRAAPVAPRSPAPVPAARLATTAPAFPPPPLMPPPVAPGGAASRPAPTRAPAPVPWSGGACVTARVPVAVLLPPVPGDGPDGLRGHGPTG